MTTPISGGRANALPQPAGTGGFEPTGPLTVGDHDGIEVDAHRTLRRVGIIAGGALALTGAALLATRGIKPAAFETLATRVPYLMPAAIGAAGLGTAIGIGSLAGLRAKTQAYDQVVDGSLRDAGAAADQLGGDVGIVSAGDGRWGLLQLEDAKADEEGAAKARLSNPPIRFAAVTSRDGDTFVRSGEDFINRGSATAIDASSIDPADAAAVRSLVGRQLAVSADGAKTVTLGEPLLGGQPAASKQEAIAKLFEAGVDDAALVDTGRGVLAYRAGGAADGLFARGAAIHPVGAVTLLSDVSNTSPTVHVAHDIAGALNASNVQRPVLDVGTIAKADAGSLVGRRVAGSGGNVERLGKLVSTHANVGEAVTAAAATKQRTLVTKLQDGAAVFELPGSATDTLVTALGGDGRLQVVQDRKLFSVASSGKVSFKSRSVPFDVKEPIGFKLDSGGVSGTAKSLLGSYGSQAAALAAIKGDLGTSDRYVVVKADGPAGAYHAYKVEGSGGRAWDTQLGGTSLGAWRDDDYRKHTEEIERRPSTWGTDLYYFDHVTTRTVRFLDEGDSRREVATSGVREVSRNLKNIVRAFDPHEAIGQTVRIGGESLRINNWIDSTDWESSARSRISTSAGDPRAYVVLERENNRGTYHVYEASNGGYGSSWNESRADVDMASWVEDRARTYEETERRQGQYGTDVYHYDVTERWRERLLSEGYGTTVTDRTSKRVERDLDYVDRADPPPPSHTSPGDDPPSSGGGHTSPGDDSGGSSGGSHTSPGDDNGSGGHSGGGSSSGNSTDNGNPSEDDF
jgi:hypothetical protein